MGENYERFYGECMVTILLATYNGQNYISEQIESILAQTVKNFKIYISDDNSQDNTFNIIREYEKKYPEKIIAIQRKENSGSPWKNFFELMISNKDEYVMLCDQDDIWLPNKIELTLSKMKQIESVEGKNIPIVVYTDMCVVNENLEIINHSFMKMMNADFKRTSLNKLLMQNTMAGCTCMYNKSLSEYFFVMPSYMVMHDWWIALVAATFGKIEFFQCKPILYRQHSNNQIGAQDVCSLKYKIHKVINIKYMKQAVANTFKQAEMFLFIYRDIIPKRELDLLVRFTNIPNFKKYRRCIELIRIGSFKNGIARKIATFIVV